MQYCRLCGNTMFDIPCGNARFTYCKRCDSVVKSDETARLLPVDMSLQAKYLSSEYSRVREDMERHQGVFAGVRAIHSRNNSVFLVLLELGSPVQDFQVRFGDVIELVTLKRLGVVQYVLDDFHIYAVFDNVHEIHEGSFYAVRKADELLLVEVQQSALQQFVDVIKPHYFLLREIILKGIRLSRPSSCMRVNLFDGKLNVAQRKAVERSLSLSLNNPFSLIHGPPGTRKTRALAEIAVQVAEAGGRILVTSHTNVAVDNILEAVLNRRSGLRKNTIRFGHAGKVNSDMRELMPKARLTDELSEQHGDICVDHYSIVGTTLSELALLVLIGKLDWSHPAFDWVVIDESSMATIPQFLVGMMLGYRLVLSGDHEQLPPVIKVDTDDEVRSSLFERLIRTHPERSIMLNVQYRCNETIAAWPSEFIYHGKLSSDESVKNIKLSTKIPTEDPFFGIVDGGFPLVWVETSGRSQAECEEYGDGPSLYNAYEAALVVELVSRFCRFSSGLI